MSSIEGAVAVVTGASRGVGRDVAEVLSTKGAQVIRVARTAERFCVDVRDPTQVAELAKEVEEEFGPTHDPRQCSRDVRSPRAVP